VADRELKINLHLEFPSICCYVEFVPSNLLMLRNIAARDKYYLQTCMYIVSVLCGRCIRKTLSIMRFWAKEKNSGVIIVIQQCYNVVPCRKGRWTAGS
jgi:hypothetical protein